MADRRVPFLAFGAALGALFLYLAVRSLDWHAFSEAIAAAHPADIALVLACLAAYYAIKAMRWRFVIAPFARATTRDLLPAVLAGLAGNYVFPHLGEIPRAMLAARRVNAPPGALLGSIAIERFFDFLALLALVLAVLLPAQRMDGELRSASLFAAALCAALLAAVALFVLRTEACLALARRLLAPLPARAGEGVVHHLRQASVGLGAISSPRLLAPIFALSLLQWLAVLGCVAFSMRAVSVPATTGSATAALLLNVIGLTLPAAPGHVGTVQLAFIVGLAPFGVARASAFAASVIYNVLMVVPTVLLGLPGLRRAGAALHERLTAR
jgi:uncharacterized protein (TIRG00374 family)